MDCCCSAAKAGRQARRLVGVDNFCDGIEFAFELGEGEGVCVTAYPRVVVEICSQDWVIREQRG